MAGTATPSERLPELVREDVENGVVGAEVAERDYGCEPVLDG